MNVYIIEGGHRGSLHEVLEKLDRILTKLDQQEAIMATDFTALTDAVNSNATVIDSAVTLLEQLSQMLKDAATDPAKITEIADSLAANSNALAAAVVANTPAA